MTGVELAKAAHFPIRRLYREVRKKFLRVQTDPSGKWCIDPREAERWCKEELGHYLFRRHLRKVFCDILGDPPPLGEETMKVHPDKEGRERLKKEGWKWDWNREEWYR